MLGGWLKRIYWEKTADFFIKQSFSHKEINSRNYWEILNMVHKKIYPLHPLFVQLLWKDASIQGILTFVLSMASLLLLCMWSLKPCVEATKHFSIGHVCWAYTMSDPNCTEHLYARSGINVHHYMHHHHGHFPPVWAASHVKLNSNAVSTMRGIPTQKWA